MFYTDLLRGATASLYSKGRVVLWLGHIRGGTQWYGAWSKHGDQIRMSLPRVQRNEDGEWKPGEFVDPPERIVLARKNKDTWVETERTIVKFVDIHLTWREHPMRRFDARDAESHHAFQPEGSDEIPDEPEGHGDK